MIAGKGNSFICYGQRIAVRENGVLSYLLADHLGSITVSLDGQNLTGTRSYSSWGETRGSAGTLPTARGYQGQYAEGELGLLFFNARWVDPQLGRFISADSIVPEPGNPGDWDRYTFVLNNPIRYSDPSGHKVWDGCSGETGGCAGKEDYADYVYGVWHTDQEREQNRENIETAVEVGTTIIGVVNEPIDWAITATYCIGGDCSPLLLLGFLPIVPSSIGKYVGHHTIPREILKKLPPELANAVRGVKGSPNIWRIPESLHKIIHGGVGYGGYYNDNWRKAVEPLMVRGNITPQEIFEIRENLISAFGLFKWRP